MSTHYSTVERLVRRGVRFQTVIDVGCADGHFFLQLFADGVLAGAVPLNIDANPIYEESLRAIQEVAGGYYRIGAVADAAGETELFAADHPYWSSIRPAGDVYWSRSNTSSPKPTTVPVATLDMLVSELDLKPPFLIKMDVQGAEAKVLRGARRVLTETLAILSEVDVADFQIINGETAAAGFDLYDITDVSRVTNGDLGWLYACYVSRQLDHLKPVGFWEEKDQAAVVAAQERRRLAILENNKKLINRIKYRTSDIDRNAPCPCNSGRRFKHCCGAFV